MPAVERKIGEHLYSVTPLPAFSSFTLQAELAPALAAVAESLGATGAADLGELEVTAVGKAAGSFFAALPRDKFARVARELLEGTTRDGQRLFTEAGNPFDVLMQGSTMDAWRLLLFSLEVNYPDFFGALAAARRAAPAPAVESTSAA